VPAAAWPVGSAGHRGGKDTRPGDAAYRDGHANPGPQSPDIAIRVPDQRLPATARGATRVTSSVSVPADPAGGPMTPAGRSAATVAVAVMADSRLFYQAAVAYLRTRAEVDVLAADRFPEAEVVLLLVDRISEENLRLMERAAESCPQARFVLVGDGAREQHLVRAIRHAPLSVVSRREADFDHVVQTIIDIREERLEMPGYALGLLERRLRTITREVLEPNGLTAEGFEKREIDVLRLLAEGLVTSEIADKLNYSERTVKYIIRTFVTRMNLRNRTHAVAYAVRSGIL
jgi:DNA-binding NarL/FixJ family response regulator